MKSLYTFWLIFTSSLRRMRLLFAASLAAGILLGVILVVLVAVLPNMDSTVRIGFIDDDTSAVSTDLQHYLTYDLGMVLVSGDESDLQAQLVDKGISAIVEVPAGFQKDLLAGSDNALLVTYMGDYENRAFIQSYLENYTGSLQILAQAAQGSQAQMRTLLDQAQKAQTPLTSVGLDAQQVKRQNAQEAFSILFGFFLILGSLISVGVVNVVFDDRTNHTYERVQVAGVGSGAYVVGVCAAGFVAAIIMVVTFMLFCLQQGMAAYLPLFPIMLMCLLFTLFLVGFALICGLFSRSRMTGFWIILAFSTVCCMLGGAYFPISYAPQVLQQIAHITPHFWLVDGVQQVINGGSGAWVLPSGILALFALLSFLVAGIRYASRQSRPI